jgi:predicted ATPase
LLGNLDLPYNVIFDVKINEAEISRYLDGMKREISVSVTVLKEGEKKDVAKILKCELDKLICDNLLTLNKAIEDKQKETKAFETTKLKYQQQKKAASAIESTIKALENEIKKIRIEYVPEKERLETERIDTYCSYFEILKNEKNQIELLYKPLQESLFAGSETDNKLVFEAKIKYRLDDHYKNGLDIIDRTRKGNFRELKSLKKELSDVSTNHARHDYEEPSIKSNLNAHLNKFMNYDGVAIQIEEQLRDEYTIEQFYNWIFDPTYYEIISSLKFDDTDLYMLSPGQKGIILVMLYLEIDKADYRPLIIDQPEENLDSFSVYRDLLKYFRDRKQYRQIIMVTHNPNLVVNADAEQIIIANYNGKRKPRLEYHSGSLEDQARKVPDIEIEKYEDGIIEQVCNILEGGEPAFKKRKNKYGISCRSNI